MNGVLNLISLTLRFFFYVASLREIFFLFLRRAAWLWLWAKIFSHATAQRRNVKAVVSRHDCWTKPFAITPAAGPQVPFCPIFPFPP